MRWSIIFIEKKIITSLTECSNGQNMEMVMNLNVKEEN